MINYENFKLLYSSTVNLFEEGFNGSGVYAAYGLTPSSRFLQPIYIGSSVNLKKRIIKEHISQLKRNKHCHNDLLQRYYNDNGEGNLIWILLEECDPEKTIEREQYWLDLERPFSDENRGFNFGHYANATWLGKTFSDEHKRKISEGNKGKKLTSEHIEKLRKINTGKIFSQETLEKLSISHKGFVHSEDSKKKMSESRTGEKNHFFGKSHTEESKRKIAEKAKGRPGFGKGQKRPKEIGEKTGNTQAKEWSFINPNGQITSFRNLNKFCRENSLDQSAMLKVNKGSANHHKGWTKLKE